MSLPIKSVAPKTGFSQEQRLLLGCSRLNLADQDRAQMRVLVDGPLDWQVILLETRRQCIVPLVYRHLHAEAPDRVPVDIFGQLRAEYLQVAVRSMELAAELHAIVMLLEAGNVPALPYKGPVLALQAYGDIALRTFTDLDILVPQADVARARKILAGRGYAPLDALTPLQEQAVLKFDHNLPLLNPASDIVVELHWRVAPVALTFTLPMEDVLARAGPLTLGGSTVRGMAADDLIILLSVHGSRHAWSAVEWITGIAELMRQPGSIDWEQVIERAERHRVGRIVRLAAALANQLLDAPISAPVARWIEQDTRIPRLIAWVSARLFSPLDLSSAAQQWAVFQYEIAVKDGFRDQLSDAYRRLTYPTGKDWEAAGISDRLFPLYRVFRPVRLLARLVRHAVTSRPKPR